MTRRPFDAEAYVDAVSDLMDLTVAPAHRPGVVRFLTIAAEMAEALETADLDEREAALAPVYTPPQVNR